MFSYILRRLLYFIPTFLIISILTFMLGQIAPGDPIELKLKGGMQSANEQVADKLQTERAYLELSEKYGRDLPGFYFSITSAAVPDTLYKIRRKADRENLEALIDKYGNWEKISDYYSKTRALEFATLSMPPDTVDPAATANSAKIVRNTCNTLYINSDDNTITNFFKIIGEQVAATTTATMPDSTRVTYQSLKNLEPYYLAAKTAYEQVKAQATPYRNYIPAIHWYGKNNQYHRFMFGDMPWFTQNTDPTKTCKGFFRMDLGKSIIDGRSVGDLLKDAMRWTLLLNLVVFTIIYCFSIPIGVKLAMKQGQTFDKTTSVILFFLNSLPIVWVGTLVVTFLTSDYYGDSLNLFPPYGLGKIGDEYGLMEKLIDRAHHFTLPVLCLTLGSLAYVSRQMRGSMLTVIRQDYIRTAFAKGLAPSKVFWKHAFRNSLIPLITMFSGLLPAMIGGAVIIEYMFNIPGMGRVSYDAVVQRDYPVLFTILLFSAVLTMLGNLLADILYAVADPRISFHKKV